MDDLLYRETELKFITKILADALNPLHIILFGSLAGGTPHSDTVTYDLLIITPEQPRYDWMEIRKFLKEHLPIKHRAITTTNIYVYSQNFKPCTPSPLLFLAKMEGKLLYSRDPELFSRPKPNFNYAETYRNTARYFATFFELGSNILRDSNHCFENNNLRQSAFYIAHAMELFYRTLFYVYHGFEIECSDLVLLRLRMRTLSSDLNMLFDSDEGRNGRLPYHINHYRKDSYSCVNFNVTKDELSQSLTKIGKMKEIIERTCQQRLNLYKNR